jgi:hypothetical protein
MAAIYHFDVSFYSERKKGMSERISNLGGNEIPANHCMKHNKIP